MGCNFNAIPQRMFNNCKRQAAESLTNAQHMQEPSSTSARRHGSRAGHLSKGNCVSKLPVIARRPPPQELAVAGKTQRRAPASPAQLSKELPPLCHKLKSVNKKKSTCKLAPSNFHTLRRRPIRRTRVAPSQEIHKEMSKTTPSLSLQALSPIPGGQDGIRGLDSRSVPLPLSSPDWTPVDWALMSSLHYRSPSPVDELDGETPDNSLSDQFCSLDLSPSQYEGEDEPLPTWVNPMSGGETRPPSPRTPVYLEPPVRLGAMFLRERDTASFRGEYSPVLPIAVAGPVFSPATLAERTQGGHLPVPTAGEHLDQLISDRRVSPTRALQDQPRTALSSAGPESSPDAVPADGSPATGTGLPSEERGELGGTSISSQRAFGLLEDLELELTELQVFQMEEMRILHGRLRERRGASPETKPPADPETLRRITESLLKEESDEEEGDLCRICLSWGGSPQNPLLSPCQCTGSLQYVHHDCLKRWIQGKVQSGAELTVVKTCELCKASLNLNLEGFNLECYRQRQAQVELRILRLLGRSLLDVPGVVVTNSNGAFTVMMLASRSRSDGTGHQAVVPSDETPDS